MSLKKKHKAKGVSMNCVTTSSEYKFTMLQSDFSSWRRGKFGGGRDKIWRTAKIFLNFRKAINPWIQEVQWTLNIRT